VTISDLWYLSEEASRRAERVYRRLRADHVDFLEFSQRRRVSRGRFRTLADRVVDSGAPFGAHTAVYRDDGAILLVRHEGVDMWVVPGGEVGSDEGLREAARRELAEEAGIEAAYEGLAIATRVEFTCGDADAWGVLPVYAARARTTAPSVSDPDGEISAAKWFDDLPPDTRDREELAAWRDTRLSATHD
jgi:ADP-ribose pyrophosphatase YjhB (NUDIX family)